MAICPDCHDEMPTMAIVCPHCGHSTAKPGPEEQIKAVVINQFRKRTRQATPLITTATILVVTGAFLGDYWNAAWLTVPMWMVAGVLFFVGVRQSTCPNCDSIVKVSARAPHCQHCGIQLHK